MSETENLRIDKDEMEMFQLLLYALQTTLAGAAQKYTDIYRTLSADLESSIGGVSAFQSDVGADKELCEFYEHLSLHTIKLCNFTGVAVEYIQRTTGVILEADEAMARMMELAGRTEE